MFRFVKGVKFNVNYGQPRKAAEVIKKGDRFKTACAQLGIRGIDILEYEILEK